MSDIVLNHDQQIAVDAAVNWFLNSPEQTFQIAGPAGTGKSVVISEILKRLPITDDEVLPMAYTGQACTVMRKRGLPSACTCHSGLFEMHRVVRRDSRGHAIMHPEFNTPMYTWRASPKDLTRSMYKLIILDEAWMVPESFRRHIDNSGIKVLAAGDPYQLPPIGGNPGYLVSGTIYHLTELMRQAENSPIVYLANRAKAGLPIEPGMYGNDALVAFQGELDYSIISKADIVLCARNETRESLNTSFRRDILHIQTEFPVYGDRMICRRNNWGKEVQGINLVNGLAGTVIRPPDIGTTGKRSVMIDFLPDMTSIPFYQLEINMNYFKSHSRKEKDMIEIDPYAPGDLFEYNYVSTVHLAQGSEYNSGVFIEEPFNASSINALIYTAITRFKHKLIYLRPRPRYWVGYDYSN